MEPKVEKSALEADGSSQLSAASKGKRILMLTSGSRGDVQPFAALASRLQKVGFEMLVVTNVDHVPFLEKFGLKAAGLSIDWRQYLTTDKDILDAQSSGSLIAFLAAFGSKNKEDFPVYFPKLVETCKSFKPDAIFPTAMEIMAGYALGYAFEVPVIYTGLQAIYPTANHAWLPGRCHGRFLFIKAWLDGEIDCKRDVIEKHLPGSTAFMQSMASFSILLEPIAPSIIGYSPTLLPGRECPADYPESLHCTGFWVVDRVEQKSRAQSGDAGFGGGHLERVSAFLRKGERPAYLGWGSITPTEPKEMACLAVRSLKLAGLRGIVLGGWANLKPEMLKGQHDSEELEKFALENVIFVDAAPHEWLFPQCSVTVHHGGSGTTAAALRSGVPTVVTPVFGDQYNNAQLAASSETGIALKQFLKITPQVLSEAMTRCITDKKMILKAAELSKQLRVEDGAADAIKVVDNFFSKEVQTGKWKDSFDKHCQKLSQVNAKRAPGCLSWMAHAFCSSNYNKPLANF